MTESMPTRELTFGEKAAGVTFNPGAIPDVDEVKKSYAAIIDRLVELRDKTNSTEAHRYFQRAIAEIECSQMFAVKAITWKF